MRMLSQSAVHVCSKTKHVPFENHGQAWTTLHECSWQAVVFLLHPLENVDFKVSESLY